MKYKSFVISILTPAILISLLVGCSSKEEKEAKYFDRAQALYDKGEFIKARLELRNLLQINRENPQAYYLQALMHEQNANWTKMSGSLHAAIEFDPEFIPAKVKLATLQFRFGPAADSQTELTVQSILDLDPQNADAIAILAQLLYRQGNRDRAMEEVRRAISIHPGHSQAIALLSREEPDEALAAIEQGLSIDPKNYELRIIKIRIMKQQEDIDGVITQYKALLSDDKENPRYFNSLLGYLAKQGRTEESTQMLEDAIASSPKDTNFKVWLVSYFRYTGQVEPAIKTAETFIASDPAEPLLRFALADAYQQSHQFPKARQVLNDIIAMGPKDPDSLKARNQLARLELQLENEPEAEKLLNEIFEIDRENTGALITGAQIALQRGDTESAILKSRTAINHDPKSQPAFLTLGVALEASGSEDLALDNYQSALKLDPRKIEVAFKITQLLLKRGDTAEANQLLEQYLTVESTAKTVGPILVASYTEQQEWDKAMEVASKLESQQDNNSLGIYLRGGTQYAQGNYADSIVSFESLITKEPNSSDALSALLKARVAQDGTEATIDYLKKFMADHPEQKHAHVFLGGLYLQQGNPDLAISAYREAIELEPGNTRAQVSLAQAYLQSGAPEAALESFDAALAASPNNTELLLLKAGLLEGLGRYQDAADTYGALLAIDDTQSIAANNLAMLLVSHLSSEENLLRAMEVSAAFESSDVPTFLDTRGWVYYQAGNYNRALSLLKRATADPDRSSPEYHYHLGMTYLKLNDKDSARVQLETSLEGEADFVGVEAAKKVLDTL